MKIVIIGAGNVATHLAKALKAVNVQVAQVWSYHYKNALQLACEVDAVAIEDLTSIDLTLDLCLIAVKDDAIVEIIPQLVNFKVIATHTSG